MPHDNDYHDLRDAIGYRQIPATDPEEQRLRMLLFEARAKHVHAGSPVGGPTDIARSRATDVLSQYIWDRACREVAEDRAKHPRLRRNAAVGSAVK